LTIFSGNGVTKAPFLLILIKCFMTVHDHDEDIKQIKKITLQASSILGVLFKNILIRNEEKIFEILK